MSTRLIVNHFVSVVLHLLYPLVFFAVLISFGCSAPETDESVTPERIRLIVDTDANNELDDQFALTYVLHNASVFDLEGVTVNRTAGGGDIQAHYDEAARILTLAERANVLLFKGASGSYEDILPTLDTAEFDGHDAVDFILERAHADDARPLILAPIGKLTNIALALTKDPSIASKVKILWLGSHWPKPGEYNLENDTSSVNPVIFSEAPFEMALVRFGYFSGTGAVKLGLGEVRERMPGLGPRIAEPITGRHGGEFYTFGDYAVNLFEHMGDEYRALYDMAALSLLKNPEWAERIVIDAPRLKDGEWVDEANSSKKIAVWAYFNTSLILKDFFETMERAGK